MEAYFCWVLIVIILQTLYKVISSFQEIDEELCPKVIGLKDTEQFETMYNI